jgi:hypothetical protein
MNSKTNKCRGYGVEGSRKGKNGMAVNCRLKINTRTRGI